MALVLRSSLAAPCKVESGQGGARHRLQVIRIYERQNY